MAFELMPKTWMARRTKRENASLNSVSAGGVIVRELRCLFALRGLKKDIPEICSVQERAGKRSRRGRNRGKLVSLHRARGPHSRSYLQSEASEADANQSMSLCLTQKKQAQKYTRTSWSAMAE